MSLQSPTPDSLAPPRVLVVDDEQASRHIVVRMIRHLGYEVDSAESGPDALDLFDLGDYGLVVTDYSMPGMTGEELTQAIAVRDNTPVLMVTGLAEWELPPSATRNLLRKPITLDDLRVAFAQLLRA